MGVKPSSLTGIIMSVKLEDIVLRASSFFGVDGVLIGLVATSLSVAIWRNCKR